MPILKVKRIMLTIEYDQGTLLLRSDQPNFSPPYEIPKCCFDIRVQCYRMPGYLYAVLIQMLQQYKIAYEDHVKAYQILKLPKLDQKPFDFQQEALEAWIQNQWRGLIVLPTGTGKTYVAMMAIATVKRSTVIIVPTLDLMNQWYELLQRYFPDIPTGVIGGGTYEPKEMTVITYDSGYRHLEHLGNRFGLAIFDECHHLPGESYLMGAEFAIAPCRLGLTATPERADHGEERLWEMIGPIVYRKDIRDMKGEYLAEYQIVQEKVQLSSEERQQYKQEHDIYVAFMKAQNINLGNPHSWRKFIMATSRSTEGRRALQAYFRQKEIAQAAPAKLRLLESLLIKHAGERILIFTNDNATAYQISDQFLVPVITCQTKTKERHAYLEGFKQGIYTILSTSRVLNEGVDIPSANVGIILSGTGSVREHVQRLGRILRKHGDKKAVLYEIITQHTSEESVSRRRRDHSAYRN